MEKYRFVIAMENTNDGLISTVLCLAVAGGSIPIYSGDIPITGTWLNQNRFIDCRDFASAEDLLIHIKTINENEEVWNSVVSQSIFIKPPPFLNTKVLSDMIQSSF
jgi:hypothetical protein